MVRSKGIQTEGTPKKNSGQEEAMNLGQGGGGTLARIKKGKCPPLQYPTLKETEILKGWNQEWKGGGGGHREREAHYNLTHAFCGKKEPWCQKTAYNNVQTGRGKATSWGGKPTESISKGKTQNLFNAKKKGG